MQILMEVGETYETTERTAREEHQQSVCVCVRACVRAFVRACARVCVCVFV